MIDNLFPPPPSARFSLPQGRENPPPGMGQLVPLLANGQSKPIQGDDRAYATREWVVMALPGPASIAAMKTGGSAIWAVGLHVEATEGAALFPLYQPVETVLAVLTTTVVPICGAVLSAHGSVVKATLVNLGGVDLDAYVAVVPGPAREYFAFSTVNGTPAAAPDFAQGFSLIVNGSFAAGDLLRYRDPAANIITTVDPSLTGLGEYPWDPFASNLTFNRAAGGAARITVRWRCLS